MTTAIVICVLAAVLVASFTLPIVRGGQRYHWPEAHEDAVRQDLTATAERLRPHLCGNPPCSPEDQWECAWHCVECAPLSPCIRHEPRGQHHAPSLRYSPMPPTVHTITDLKDWR